MYKGTGLFTYVHFLWAHSQAFQVRSATMHNEALLCIAAGRPGNMAMCPPLYQSCLPQTFSVVQWQLNTLEGLGGGFVCVLGFNGLISDSKSENKLCASVRCIRLAGDRLIEHVIMRQDGQSIDAVSTGGVAESRLSMLAKIVNTNYTLCSSGVYFRSRIIVPL